jgi:hypothetical protein
MAGENVLTDYGKNSTRRLAGLDTLGGQVESLATEVGRSADAEFMKAVRDQIHQLSVRISELIEKRQPNGQRFQAK